MFFAAHEEAVRAPMSLNPLSGARSVPAQAPEAPPGWSEPGPNGHFLQPAQRPTPAALTQALKKNLWGRPEISSAYLRPAMYCYVVPREVHSHSQFRARSRHRARRHVLVEDEAGMAVVARRGPGSGVA